MANEWQSAVKAAIDIVRAISGIKTATYPEDSQNADLFAVGYVGDCEDIVGPPGVRKSLGEIHIELCTSATDTKIIVDKLMPYAGSIPAELLKTANYKLSDTVETFAGMRRTGIAMMPISGYVGIRFTLYGVKITSTIT